MAKNYASTGDTVVIAAPTAGTTAGKPLVVNDLVLIPLQTAVKDQQVTCRTVGAWTLPAAAGLKLGNKVSVAADGSLVADGTASSTPFGKLLSEVVNGSAVALLIP